MEAGIVTMTVIIIVVSFAFAIGITIFAIRKVGHALGGSPEKQAQAQQLMATGEKARATILAITPTGTVINHINIGCEVRFRLDPLSGSPSFEAPKSMYINQTQMPRVGDVWPAWYDASDPGTFAVGMPQLGDPNTIPIFREFGIPHPFDQAQAQSTPATAAPGGESRVDELERLAQLHRDGVISDAELAAEKQRLLGS